MLLEYLEEIGLAVKDVYAGLRISAPRARAQLRVLGQCTMLSRAANYAVFGLWA